MEQDIGSRISTGATVVCVKSWTAYMGVLLLALVLFGAALPLAFMASEILAACVLALAAILVIYQVLAIRSVQLYYDDIGVWLVSGILPWKKGVVGVKWRDMDEATFTQGFWSWLSNSYSIRIGHRFTKTSEIALTRMGRGKQAVGTLNAHLQELIRTNRVG